MRTRLGLVALALSLPLLATPPSGATGPAGAGSSAAGSSSAGSSGAGSSGAAQKELRFEVVVVDPDQSFRGLDAVDRRTAWVSGASVEEGGDARVYRSTDRGRSWQDVSPPNTAGLSFRDVEARSSTVATVLAIGEGKASRIYRTTDGGETWTETFRNREKAAFYNCLDFYPGGRRGLAVSDPVDGKFRIIRTDDGGRSWEVVPEAGMPDSTGEANFSASGDCLVVRGRHAWFGSGGTAARIYHSHDFGTTWRASESAIPAGEAAGVFALAFRTSRHGIAVGGDFEVPEDGVDTTAVTRDRRTWTSGGDMEHLGEDASWVSERLLVVVGEGGEVGGVSVSRDGGATWRRLDGAGYHTLDCTADGACWAAGGGGRVGLMRR